MLYIAEAISLKVTIPLIWSWQYDKFWNVEWLWILLWGTLQHDNTDIKHQKVMVIFSIKDSPVHFFLKEETSERKENNYNHVWCAHHKNSFKDTNIFKTHMQNVNLHSYAHIPNAVEPPKSTSQNTEKKKELINWNITFQCSTVGLLLGGPSDFFCGLMLVCGKSVWKTTNHPAAGRSVHSDSHTPDVRAARSSTS